MLVARYALEITEKARGRVAEEHAAEVFEPRRREFFNDTAGAICGADRKPLVRSFTTLSRTRLHSKSLLPENRAQSPDAVGVHRSASKSSTYLR